MWPCRRPHLAPALDWWAHTWSTAKSAAQARQHHGHGVRVANPIPSAPRGSQCQPAVALFSTMSVMVTAAGVLVEGSISRSTTSVVSGDRLPVRTACGAAGRRSQGGVLGKMGARWQACTSSTAPDLLALPWHVQQMCFHGATLAHRLGRADLTVHARLKGGQVERRPAAV